MEIMYSNKNYEILKKDCITGIYGDKVDLVNFGFDFNGIDLSIPVKGKIPEQGT